MSDTPKTDAVIAFAPHYPGSPYQERIHKLCAELERENAELREDKARLDWLDSIGRNVKNVNMDGVWREWSHRDYLNTKASLRESIDAARKEAQP